LDQLGLAGSDPPDHKQIAGFLVKGKGHTPDRQAFLKPRQTGAPPEDSQRFDKLRPGENGAACARITDKAGGHRDIAHRWRIGEVADIERMRE
jgi:hypothetical protein